MRALGTTHFLTLDAGLDLASATRLVRATKPEFLVVRAEPSTIVAGRGSYHMFTPADLETALANHADWVRLAELVADELVNPTVVFDADDLWAADPPTDPTTELTGVVVNDVGIVSRVLSCAPWSSLPDEVGPRMVMRNITGVEGAFLSREVSGGSGGPDMSTGWRLDERQLADWHASDDAADLLAFALDVVMAESVRLGDVVPVLVQLVPGPGGPGTAPLTAEEGEVLEVMVSMVSGFTLVSAPVAHMVVRRDGDTLPVKFDVRATEEGKGVVKVLVFRGTQGIAVVNVGAVIGAEAETAGASSATASVVAAIGAAADLDLIVLSERIDGVAHLRYRLVDTTRQITAEMPPRRLDLDPGAYVHAKFEEIAELHAYPWSAAAAQRLAAIGAHLYEHLVPEQLRLLLWECRSRVRSLLVQTEEPWIPWEMCRMTVQRDGRTEEAGYLCEEFNLARWLPGVPPKPDLQASRVGVIAPLDSGLDNRKVEPAMLNQVMRGVPVERITETYAAVLEALSAHRYDVIHLVGHGVNTEPTDVSQSVFRLSGRWKLKPSDIAGEVRNLGLASPIVFMNACQVGQAGQALHGVGGWAAEFTRAGAGAFVGTHWDVRDDLALQMATHFYRHLSTKKTLPQALRAARKEVRNLPGGDATYLAYTLHAAPNARCSLLPA